MCSNFAEEIKDGVSPFDCRRVYVCLPVTSPVEEVNVTSSVGAAVTLACRTSYSDVDWRHQDTPTSGVYYVYSNGVVYDIFRPRFTVDRRPAQGQFDLVISRVQLDDAGLYVCIDDAGLGEPIYIHQLSVIPAGVHTHFTYLLITKGSFSQTLFETLIRDVYAFLLFLNETQVLATILFLSQTGLIINIVNQGYGSRGLMISCSLGEIDWTVTVE